MIQARDDAIHVSYSYFTPEGKSIKHARFNEEWVRAGDFEVLARDPTLAAELADLREYAFDQVLPFFL